MAKVFVKCETGYCGEESHEVIDVEYTASELIDRCSTQSVAIDAIVHEMAIENAQMYGRDEVDDELDEDPLESVYGSWEIYDSGEHDAYLMPGCVPE